MPEVGWRQMQLRAKARTRAADGGFGVRRLFSPRSEPYRNLEEDVSVSSLESIGPCRSAVWFQPYSVPLSRTGRRT